ncbi:MAG: hypothetical protein ACFFFG_00855 [Candidatus Thorarchaeota archaeon]
MTYLIILQDLTGIRGSKSCQNQNMALFSSMLQGILFKSKWTPVIVYYQISFEFNTWFIMEISLSKKINNGFSPLKEKSILVAFSGDINSSLVARIIEERASTACLATVISVWLDETEIQDIRASAAQFHLPHVFETIPAYTLSHTYWGASDSCFYCKIHISSHLLDYAKRMGYDVVIDGSDASSKDYLPYFFPISKLGVYSPLAMGEITNDEVQALFTYYSLTTDIQNLKICPSERFPAGRPINRESIDRVLKAESYLKSLGLFDRIKVSDHENLCRILVDRESFNKAAVNLSQNRAKIVKYLKALGYAYIVLDLEGENQFFQPEH